MQSLKAGTCRHRVDTFVIPASNLRLSFGRYAIVLYKSVSSHSFMFLISSHPGRDVTCYAV